MVFQSEGKSRLFVNKYKEIIVPKVYHQQFGFDFNTTLSHVVKPTTIRIILTLALTNRWEIHQTDINNAFLNDSFQEEVFMTQPTSFEQQDPTIVCMFNKAMYGLKQTPRALYEN